MVVLERFFQLTLFHYEYFGRLILVVAGAGDGARDAPGPLVGGAFVADGAVEVARSAEQVPMIKIGISR